MLNTALIDQDIVKRFARLMRVGRLAHAYLFSGPAGIGKSQTALAVAKLLNCESREDGRDSFCDACPACVKINSGNHPDLFLVERGPEADSIKIQQVRELITRLQMRAFEAKIKVCIIRNIEHLTDDSSNALLKTLEEPVKDSVLFLTTAVPEENLQTVVSRCHHIKFFPLSVAGISQRLSANEGLAPAIAGCLAHFSQGCMGQALALKDSDFIRRKNEIIDNLVLRESHEPYLKKVLSDKDATKEAVGIIFSWFRDLAVLKAGGQRQHIAHLDRYDELSTLKNDYSMQHLNGILEEAVGTLRMIGENLNVKIPLILLREKIWAR